MILLCNSVYTLCDLKLDWREPLRATCARVRNPISVFIIDFSNDISMTYSKYMDVRYDSRFVKDVLFKKFTKILTAPRIAVI